MIDPGKNLSGRDRLTLLNLDRHFGRVIQVRFSCIN